jgi:hypothetical protein
MGMREFNRFGYYSAATWFRLLSAGIIFFALIQFLALALSLTRTIISQPVALAILGVAAGGAFGLDRFFHRRETGHPVDCEDSMPSAGIFKWLVPLLLFLLGFTVINAYLHPFIFADCAIYHLPTIHYWGEKGFIHWVDLQPSEIYYTDSFINGYPKAAELMGFVTIHATGIAGLVHLLNAWFLMLGISGVAFMARQFGASAGGSLAAGLLYALVPANMQQLNGTYVDSAFASAVVALFAVMVHFAVNKSGKFMPWYSAIVFGACAGLVLGIKGSGPLPVGLAGTAALILLVLPWKGLSLEARRAARCRAFAWLTTVLTVAFLVGGYWYVRNLVHTGNPLYPVAVKIGNFVKLPGFSRDSVMNEAANIPQATAGWSDRARVVYNWMQGGPAHWPFSVCSVSGRLGGLGLIWLLGCCPAFLLIYFAFRKNRQTPGLTRALGALIITTAAIFLLTPMHWWARYTIWLLGAGLPCLVVVLERIWSGRFRKWGLFWSALLFLVFLVETLVGAGWLACASPVDWYGGSAVPPRAMLSLDRLSWNRPFTSIDNTNSGSIYRELSGNFQAAAIGPLNIWKGLSGPMMGMFGTICDPLGRRPVFLMGRESIRYPKKNRIFLQKHNIRYVIWDATEKCPPAFKKLSTRQEEIGPFRYFVFDPLTTEPPDK